MGLGKLGNWLNNNRKKLVVIAYCGLAINTLIVVFQISTGNFKMLDLTFWSWVSTFVCCSITQELLQD